MDKKFEIIRPEIIKNSAIPLEEIKKLANEDEKLSENNNTFLQSAQGIIKGFIGLILLLMCLSIGIFMLWLIIRILFRLHNELDQVL